MQQISGQGYNIFLDSTDGFHPILTIHSCRVEEFSSVDLGMRKAVKLSLTDSSGP